MAQQGGRRKQAPAYSADTLALRYLAGLALAAFGVMIFMAVDLGMTGNIFEGIRQVSFGVSGSMAYILAALPLWAGGLVIWSAQRRAPVRPWIFAVLSFACICAFIMLVSGNGMESLHRRAGGNWGGVIGTAYTDSVNPQRQGGGALGAMLAWPFWTFLGQVLGTFLFFLLTVFCVLMTVNLTPLRIRDLVNGQAGLRREQQQAERMRAEEQQMAWQQQQALMQQQQAYILEQQQAYRQQPVQQPVQQPMQQPMQQPVQQFAQTVRPVQPPAVNSVENWQEQMTARQAAETAPNGHESKIFAKKKDEEAEKPIRSWSSRIFGRKEPKYDGLVGEETGETEDSAAGKGRGSVRRTATGERIRKPETLWNLGKEEEEAAAKKPEEVPVSTNRDAYRRPENRKEPERPAVQPRQEVPPREEKPVRENPMRTAETEIPVKTEPRKETNRTETDRIETNRTETNRMETNRKETPDRKRPVVPEVQQEIGREAFTPELKLKPSEKRHEDRDEEWIPAPYHYPPITDLAQARAAAGDTSAEDDMRSRKLEETLASFRVQARVVNVTHGPAISRFEMELAAGTKVSKVAELEKDIAYGMEATSVIEAPIPGQSLVGVEVPNRQVATVTLREVLESDRMQNARSLLTVALGKDIAGTPIVCDLTKMPHMLIAGQTGSGKSVCINAIINSLLYRASPDEVKLILVDPKVVELQCYNGIPHLLIPVVNDPHKAAAALAWAVAEMMERYDKFSERGVRNLDGYNAALQPHEKPMARIVIIIDELADLMMVCKKDVEEYICRLTQLARAAGIHLIVATQRPSVDVITGLIKANIPSRIAFKTASSVDSRTILDRNGSEQLLGWGDMLYLPTGSFAPTRVQGCFLSDEEVNRIVAHVREANPSTYDPNILERVEEIANGGNTEGTGADLIGGDMGGGDGNLFEQAVEYAIADGQISTSMLQRRLKIGYARAGRLTDEMEERGIVAAKDGSKPRKCLITREEWEEMKKSTEGMG